MPRSGLWMLIGLLLAGDAVSAPRDVMFRSIDTSARILELHNFGTVDEPLDGWRFCSQDLNEVGIYSDFFGFSGVTIEAGTSVFLHFLNDAPANPDHINLSGVAPVAAPLGNGPYAISLFFPPTLFDDPNAMADHLQWNLGGLDSDPADHRSDEAEAAGLWIDQSAWVATAADTTLILLKPGAESSILHGPDDYETFTAPAGGAGAVPDGASVPGTPLTLSLAGGILTLDWGASCGLEDTDYEIYQGGLGVFNSHVPIQCSTGGLTSSAIVSPSFDAYYLVVATDGVSQGSYGADGSGTERPASASACVSQSMAPCP